MEEGECLLDSIFDDVEMVDVEDGQLLEDDGEAEVKPPAAPGSATVGGGGDGGSENTNKMKKKKKKKNRRKKGGGGGGGAGINVTDVNRFVLDVCRRLREKKSYMVYAAVGCLGISALNNLVTEVDVVQSCGGQMTSDGRRARTGGGILWNIIKTREPMAYKEIMKKTKEFENQFKQQNRPVDRSKEVARQEDTSNVTNEASIDIGNGSMPVPQKEPEQATFEVKRTSIHDRLRVPVSYDDLLGDDTKDDSARFFGS